MEWRPGELRLCGILIEVPSHILAAFGELSATPEPRILLDCPKRLFRRERRFIAYRRGRSCA
jgi:hypothetical protein